MGRVNELHLAAAVGGLVLAQHPDIGGNAGVHKLVGGKLNNGVQPIVFQDILTDIAGAASGITGKQRRAVLDDRHFAARRQLGQTVEHKKLLSVADFRQTGRKAPQLALGSFVLHCLLFPFPVDAEGRIGNAVPEGEARKLIVGERIPEPHIIGIAAPDHHIRLCNGEGGGVKLLPEASHLHIAVQLVDALLHTGKHL